MANLNKVMLIGRLTRDPEVRSFGNGGKVAKIGFAVNNRKKNQQTGAWEDVPVYIDCEVFNVGENGRQADLVEQSLRKGHQVYLEGRLELDQWDDKATGQKRSKLKVRVENFQFLEKKQDAGGSYGGGGSYGDDEGDSRPARSAAPAARKPAAVAAYNDGYDDAPNHGSADEIPF